MNNMTIDYYNSNADTYASTTVSVNFAGVQEKFLSKLQKGMHILDFGCGSGRDTKYFLDKGYQVSAVDGSEELCVLAGRYTGITVRHMYFQEFNEFERYNGIWACASILHLNKEELKSVLQKITVGLKEHGIIYTCFKYGEFEGMRDARYYTDFTMETFPKFINDISGLRIEEMSTTGDVLPGRGDKRWLNILLRKN